MESARLHELTRSSGSDPAAALLEYQDAERARSKRARRRLSGMAALERMVQVEIVPRLVLARRDAAAEAHRAEDVGSAACTAQIEQLAKVLVTGSDAAAFAFVDDLRIKGTPIERIYLDVVSPAARHLGDLWLADACSFTDVTVGLWRLQHVLRNMSPVFQLGAGRGMSRHQALLVPMPGEQHTFGLYMVAEFFRRAGWNVTSMPLQTANELITMVRGEWFSLVGLSLGWGNRLDELAANIRVIRRASRNRSIGVMVGGSVFIDHPELVATVGADMMARDGRQAPGKAQELVMSLAENQ